MRAVRRTGEEKGTNKNRVSYSSARRNLAESKSVYPILRISFLFVCLRISRRDGAECAP